MAPASSALISVPASVTVRANHALAFFFLYGAADHRDLHSFPTRRSSDLRLPTIPSTRPHGSVDRPPRRDGARQGSRRGSDRSEEHTSELQSQSNLVCRLLLEKKKEMIPFVPAHGVVLAKKLQIAASGSSD